MKTRSLLSIAALGLTLLSTPVRADEPGSDKLSPEARTFLKELLKELDLQPDEVTGTSSGESAPAPNPGGTSKPQPRGATTSLQPSLGLRTGSLSTGSLTPSTSLSAHGTKDGVVRLSDIDWRALFSIKSPK